MLAERDTIAQLPTDDVRFVVDPLIVDLVSQLQALSVQQRAVVVLRYVGGFSPAEIAALLQTSAGTVRVQLHRAHAALE